jgi:hypothetical protein
LQSLVGCGLAAGIVPVHATETDFPALLGTVTLCVAGVAAPPCIAPSATATSAAATAAVAALKAARLPGLGNLGMRPPAS